MGLQEEALQSIQQAVDIYQVLALKYPTAHKSDLIQSLKILSSRLSDLGFTDEAFEIDKEVLGLLA